MSRKCCVITGASRGIGRATALRMARDGFDIVAAARRAGPLGELRTELGGLGVECETIACDVARPADAEVVVRAAESRFGRIDVLVNNAGTAPRAAIDGLATAEFDKTQALNCGAVFHLTRMVWPIMKRQRNGVIVNVSSMASVDPFAGFAVYGATKAWVNLFTKATADEGEAAGIRAFAVAPGAVETELLRALFGDFPREKCLSPEEVADVIAGCCGAGMTARSGETLFVNK